MSTKKLTRNKKGHGVSLDASRELPDYEKFLNGIPEKRTAETYHYALGKWALFLSKQKSVQAGLVSTWTDVLLADFHTWLISQGFQRSSVSCYISAVHRYFKYLEVHGLLRFSIERSILNWEETRGGKRYSARSRVRSPDSAVPQIVSYYDNIELPKGDTYKAKLGRLTIFRARAIVHTLYASAGRVSELVSLTRDDVRDGRLSECKITGKGDKPRYLLLTPEAQRAISSYCKERDDNAPALFVSHGRNIGSPLDRRSIWRIVDGAVKALKIEGFAAPHAFRHYRAQQLLKAGMSIDNLQAYLGHADISLTRRVYAPETSLAKIRADVAMFGVDAETAIKNTGMTE